MFHTFRHILNTGHVNIILLAVLLLTLIAPKELSASDSSNHNQCTLTELAQDVALTPFYEKTRQTEDPSKLSGAAPEILPACPAFTLPGKRFQLSSNQLAPLTYNLLYTLVTSSYL